MIMTEKKKFIFITFLLMLFIVGCTKTPVAPVSNTITFDTGVGAGAANIIALPAAIEGQPYSVNIEPTGGAGPYVCDSVPAGSNIIGDIRLTAGCIIVGTAPMLSPGTTHGIYPVVFTIRDANNILSGPFNLALEVVKREQQVQGAPVQQGNLLVEEDSTKGRCTSPFDGKWTGHLTGEYTDAYRYPRGNGKFETIPNSESVSIDVSFTLKCALRYEESNGPGGIMMELTDFSNNYPDFNCAGCKLSGDALKTVLDGEEIHAISFKFGPQPDTYSFNTANFMIDMPNEEYLNGIVIYESKKPFTFTSGINTISDSYSWKSSYPGDSPDLLGNSWELNREGVNPFDCRVDRAWPAGAVSYDGCREVKNSYTLTKLS